MERSGRSRGSKHWSASEAKGVLEELSASGLALPEFCRRRGLNPGRVRWWKQRVEANGGGNRLPAFLPVRVRGGDPVSEAAAPPIEVVAGGGWLVRVPHGAPAGSVRSVLAAVREVASC